MKKVTNYFTRLEIKITMCMVGLAVFCFVLTVCNKCKIFKKKNYVVERVLSCWWMPQGVAAEHALVNATRTNICLLAKSLRWQLWCQNPPWWKKDKQLSFSCCLSINQKKFKGVLVYKPRVVFVVIHQTKTTHRFELETA